jgi:hypothetical protein
MRTSTTLLDSTSSMNNLSGLKMSELYILRGFSNLNRKVAARIINAPKVIFSVGC